MRGRTPSEGVGPSSVSGAMLVTQRPADRADYPQLGVTVADPRGRMAGSRPLGLRDRRWDLHAPTCSPHRPHRPGHDRRSRRRDHPGRRGIRTAGPAAGPTVYVGELTLQQLGDLRRAGFDREDLTTTGAGTGGKVGVEVVTERGGGGQAGRPGPAAGGEEGRRRAGLAADGRRRPSRTVFRSYSEPGGIRDELRQVARDHPGADQARARSAPRSRASRSTRSR